MEDRDTAFYNKAWEAQQKMASIDGAAQWTCTAASTEVPERDELYDRKTDPFQLNNIAHEHKDVAMRLLDELNIFMDELRKS
mgnify:CR=1 FL=1